MEKHITFLLFLCLSISISPSTASSFNIINFGAKPDGHTDSAKPFLNAWAAACATTHPASIYIPPGKFFLTNAQFQGPCKSANMKIYIDGTIIAPSAFPKSSIAPLWLAFKYVDGLSIFGGTLDGQGQSFWAYKTSGKGRSSGATLLTIAESNNVLISGMTLLNSEAFQLSIYGSTGVTVQGVKIFAPANSPNTDGIHIQMSRGVSITGSTMETGDDCISIGEGVSNVWIEHVSCGPGHGISIGSLGGEAAVAGVENVTVKSATFTGTQNGIRIKTWGKPGAGYVTGVSFMDVAMNNVENPIVVDQNYCPSNLNCPGQSSGIKISNVMYRDVHGSSAMPVAIKFDCSKSNPCRGMWLENIKLTYRNGPSTTYCRHVHGKDLGLVIPPSCLRGEV